MTTLAPGSYASVTAAPPSPNGVVPTGTWFVTGETQQGPTGVAIPITSLTDYENYLGPRVSYGLLYDSLDQLRDGGVLAYVSRVVGPGAATAFVDLQDRDGSPQNTLNFAAAGAGSWGNSISVVVANAQNASNAYTIQVLLNGVAIGNPSPNLFSPADAVTWFAAQQTYQSMVVCTNDGSSSSAPANNPNAGTFTLGGGSDDTGNVTEGGWTNALVAFTDTYGPGQVSAPGHTTSAGYLALTAHAQAFNRIAVLDIADNPSAASLTPQAAGVQTGAQDPTYASMFAPWIIIPGISSINPGASSPIPNRVVPPSALAAARMSSNDQSNDANKAAAGPTGQSSYAVGVTQTYDEADRATLNNAGINVVRQIQNVTTVYGYQSLATDPNWIQLSWTRFRMQMVNDFSNIADGFVFGEIDGKGQLFSQLNGALAGQCQQYWINNSLFGAAPQDAFTVNTGPQINTPASIEAGGVNAQVLVRLSPTAEVVTINVVKYLASTPLPSS